MFKQLDKALTVIHRHRAYPLGILAGLVVLHFIQGIGLLQEGYLYGSLSLASVAMAFIFMVGKTFFGALTLRGALLAPPPRKWSND